MSDTAVAELEPKIGLRNACDVVGVAQASYYRRHRHGPSPQRPAPIPHTDRPQPRALSETERAAILAELHSERFVDTSPTEVWATLLDEGRYLGSISTFYNVYSDLRSAELSAGAGSPIVFANRMDGDTYGVELWGNYRIADWWRVVAGANWLHKNLHFEAGSSGLGGIPLAGDDPTYQLSFRSTMNIATDWALDLDLRHIGALPNPASPSYTELDGRVAWTVTRALEIALTGSNLLHAHHLEFGTTGAPLQIGSSGVETQRSFVLSAKWKF